ncbi:hypothetical protein MNBD_ALPHA12-481, partial [hydrothermal vent metagenome]
FLCHVLTKKMDPGLRRGDAQGFCLLFCLVLRGLWFVVRGSWFDKLTMKAQDEARFLIVRPQFVMLGQPVGVRTKPPSIHL